MQLKNVKPEKSSAGELWLKADGAVMVLSFAAPDIIRLRFAAGNAIPEEETFVVESVPAPVAFEMEHKNGSLVLTTAALRVAISLAPLAIEVRDLDGKLRVAMPAGELAELRDGTSLLRFSLRPGEGIYGLGQDPMAHLNQRGYERRMWHEWSNYRRSGNGGMPFCISSAGYALLLNSSRASRFAVGEAQVSEPPSNPCRYLAPPPWPREEHSGESDPERMAVILDGGIMDVFLICRDSIDELHRGYYELTGRPVLLPRWAFGLIQCKNRYRTQEELLEVGREYRRRGIPCDVLVIDWLWFKQFGDLEWDRQHWPDPPDMFRELADLDFHVLQAQHPYIDRDCLKYEEFKQAGWLNQLPSDNHGRPTFDHSNPAARDAWWQEIKRFYAAGVRGYWTDMGELEEHPAGTTHYLGSRERIHNVYSTLWTKGLYEHQRRDFPDERVFSLPRTAYPGIQRYGTALWSGDIVSTWEVFHDQVVIGQGVCLSGQPLWTTDVGGFVTEPDYTPELYVRWLQWGVFCPIFRTHGTRPGNEPWSFGPEAEALVKEYIELRYRLLPYVYSLVRRVHDCGEPIMRAMCVDFGDDPVAVAQDHQFMFGPAFLVAPVTEEGARSRRVYLPAGDWYDFWTDEKFTGPCWIDADAPLARIPLYVRAGAVVPMLATAPASTNEAWTDIEVNAWAGAAGRFDLYDDDGLSYAYEKGAFAVTPLAADAAGNVTVGEVHGDASCIPAGRNYRMVMHTGGQQELPPVEVNFDRVEYGTGRCVLRAVLINRTGADLPVTLRITEPCGWRILAAPLVLYGRPRTESQHTVGERAEFVWELYPTASALPIIGRGQVEFEIGRGDSVWREVREFVTGSGWAARWQVAVNFPNDKDNSGLATVYEPERNPDMPAFDVDGKTVCYRRIERNEFNCFGYVDMMSTDAGEYNAGFGVGYARCRVWSPEARQARVEMGAEGSARLWVNGDEVLSFGDIALTQVHEPTVRLRQGWNELLLKVAVNHRYPWSGRDFGFNFRLTDMSGQPMEDVLYQP
jgi:alpha-glucosidase (family GH31 glycosyl hydrolase)